MTTSAVILACGLMSQVASDADLAAFAEAKAHAGHDAAAQVRLALWCEAHGLSAERTKLLARAVLNDPSNALARGLMGMVAYRGHWKRPDAVAEKVKTDEKLTAALAQYNARREKAPETAEAQWALALWCERNGLAAEAQAHFSAVTRLDPSREPAWKKLGFKKAGGRWVTDAQLVAEKAEIEAQRAADRIWKPRLIGLRTALGDKARQAEAEEALASVNDPRALRSVWAVLVMGSPAHHDIAVQVIGQIDSPAASKALAILAVVDPSSEVRRAAIETLKRRDRREFLDLWISLLRDKINYQVRPVGGPGNPGAILVQGKKFNVQRIYAPPAIPNILLVPGTSVTLDANGLPAFLVPSGQVESLASEEQLFGPTSVPMNPRFQNMLTTMASGALGAKNQQIGQALGKVEAGAAKQGNSLPPFGPGNYRVTRERELEIPIGEMILEARRSAAVAEQQLEGDVQQVEASNSAIHQSNTPVLLALNQITGQDLGEDQDAWSRWWVNEQGYASPRADYTPRPTVIDNVPLGYVPDATPIFVDGPIVSIIRTHSCFASGTEVQTLTGLRPIETIRVGDQVLSQNNANGQLSFQPVVMAFHNPPNRTLRIRLGNDSITATGIHRFWKAGKGWVMARDLKPGDALRTLDGVVAVDSVEDAPVQPVFNLEVASGNSFFVGRNGTLVHDNSVVEPTPEPFDSAPALPVTSGGRGSRSK